MVRIALVDNSTLTAVQRVLGHAPVRDRSVVDGDLVALEGLVQTVLFYDHVFFLDDYKERHRPQRRADFARLLPLKPTPDAYARLVECARGAAEQIVPRVEGGVFTDEDFRPFFDLLQMNVVFTWDMASSEYFLTVKMLEGASGVDLDKYGRLMSMIYADLADKRRTGQSVDAKQAAQLVDSRGRPIPYPHPETYRKDFHLTKEVMTFFTGLSWLAFRTVLYTLLARQLGVDLVLHPIRQAFQANTLTRLRLEEPSVYRALIAGMTGTAATTLNQVRAAGQPFVLQQKLPMFTAWLARRTGDSRAILGAAYELRDTAPFLEARAQLTALEEALAAGGQERFATEANRLVRDVADGAARLRSAFQVDTPQGVPLAPLISLWNAGAALARLPQLPRFDLNVRQLDRLRDLVPRRGFRALYRNLVGDLATVARLGDLHDVLTANVRESKDATSLRVRTEPAGYFGRSSDWKIAM